MINRRNDENADERTGRQKLYHLLSHLLLGRRTSLYASLEEPGICFPKIRGDECSRGKEDEQVHPRLHVIERPGRRKKRHPQHNDKLHKADGTFSCQVVHDGPGNPHMRGTEDRLSPQCATDRRTAATYAACAVVGTSSGSRYKPPPQCPHREPPRAAVGLGLLI